MTERTASEIARISNSDSFIIASSIECIHSYSLIHDDLPCMDDDNYRRGKLSTHKKFDEATALLAGNSLLTLAFELLADKKTHPDSFVRSEIIKISSELDVFISSSLNCSESIDDCLISFDISINLIPISGLFLASN